MAGNFKVGMTLTATDEATAVLVKGIKLTTKTAADAEKATERASKEQKKSAEQSGRSTRAAADESRRLASARETLGIRSEKTIQREIDRTLASYGRLTRSGVLSGREQERAYDAAIAKVRTLQREMGSLAQASKAAGEAGSAAARQQASISPGGLLREGASVAGGVAAAGAVMSRPVMKSVDYESEIMSMANTAFSEGGLKGRQEGRKELDATIRKAVNYGGGSKEDAVKALSSMLSSGVIDKKTASNLLPHIMKYATATNSNPEDLVGIAVAGKKNFGLTDKDIPVAFNMAIAAGKAGGFEIADMAGYLSSQMATAKSAGMGGIDDFGKLLALNEAARNTAGNSAEAGNNVLNLLGKLNSSDTIATARKTQYNGKGIDLPGSLASARERNIDPIEAFSRIVDKVASSSPQYQAMQKRLSEAEGDIEKQRVLEQMATIIEGGTVGKIVPDRQALLAFLGYRNAPEYRKEIEEKLNQQKALPEGQREGDIDYAFMASSVKEKLSKASNAHDFAQIDSVSKQTVMVGNIAESLAELETRFPKLASVAESATTAIQAMTAAAVAFAGIKFLTGGGAGAAASAASGATGAAGAAAGAAAKGGGMLSALGRLTGIAGAATAMATFTTDEEDEEVMNGKARWKAIREKYPQPVIDAARKKYQPWYQFGEGYSGENERWIAQYLEDQKKNGISNAMPAPAQVMPAVTPGATPSGAPQQDLTAPAYLSAPQPAFAPINLTTQLVIDGQTIAEVVNQHNVLDANRGTGGG